MKNKKDLRYAIALERINLATSQIAYVEHRLKNMHLTGNAPTSEKLKVLCQLATDARRGLSKSFEHLREKP